MNINEQWHRHLGAYGICLQDGKLLVIQKGGGPYSNRYDLPGGTIEPNESLTEALRREYLEEAGLHVHIQQHIGVCDYLVPHELPKRGTSHIHHVAVLYHVQAAGGTLAEKTEIFSGQDSLGALWVPLDQLTADNSSPLVTQAVDWLSTGSLPVDIQRLDHWVVLPAKTEV